MPPVDIVRCVKCERLLKLGLVQLVLSVSIFESGAAIVLTGAERVTYSFINDFGSEFQDDEIVTTFGDHASERSTEVAVSRGWASQSSAITSTLISGRLQGEMAFRSVSEERGFAGESGASLFVAFNVVQDTQVRAEFTFSSNAAGVPGQGNFTLHAITGATISDIHDTQTFLRGGGFEMGEETVSEILLPGSYLMNITSNVNGTGHLGPQFNDVVVHSDMQFNLRFEKVPEPHISGLVAIAVASSLLVRHRRHDGVTRLHRGRW